MNRRVLRNALFLAGEAEKKIRAQGRPTAPAEDLLVALWPAAKAITKVKAAGSCHSSHIRMPLPPYYL